MGWQLFRAKGEAAILSGDRPAEQKRRPSRQMFESGVHGQQLQSEQRGQQVATEVARGALRLLNLLGLDDFLLQKEPGQAIRWMRGLDSLRRSLAEGDLDFTIRQSEREDSALVRRGREKVQLKRRSLRQVSGAGQRRGGFGFWRCVRHAAGAALHCRDKPALGTTCPLCTPPRAKPYSERDLLSLLTKDFPKRVGNLPQGRQCPHRVEDVGN